MRPRLNLLAPEVHENPYPYYAELRRSGTLCEVEPFGFFGATRYDDVVFILKNPDLFSSRAMGDSSATSIPFQELRFSSAPTRRSMPASAAL